MRDDQIIRHTPPTDAGRLSYNPRTLAGWEDPDPKNIQQALDRIGNGHCGVALISATAPTTPGTGQLWLDTAASGSGGAGILTVNTITADLTLTTSHTVLLCDASTGAITLTLPAASANTGRQYIIKKIDSSVNTVTVDGNANETIDGGLTAVIANQYESITIVCDGSNWHLH